jgi:hypothetical protein
MFNKIPNSPYTGRPMQLVQESLTFIYRGEEISVIVYNWLCDSSNHTFDSEESLDWNLGEIHRVWRERRINKIIK